MSLDLDVTYIIVLALFLVPVVFLNGIVFKPFMALFEERHERLEGAVERAKDMLEEAQAEHRTFDEKIKVATARGMDIRDQIRSKAQDDMNAKLTGEKTRLAEKLEGALAELEKKRREALADVHVEAEKIAELTAGKLLGRNI
jgi:F-type H+-transporting ATPase subunit b